MCVHLCVAIRTSGRRPAPTPPGSQIMIAGAHLLRVAPRTIPAFLQALQWQTVRLPAPLLIDRCYPSSRGGAGGKRFESLLVERKGVAFSSLLRPGPGCPAGTRVEGAHIFLFILTLSTVSPPASRPEGVVAAAVALAMLPHLSYDYMRLEAPGPRRTGVRVGAGRI